MFKLLLMIQEGRDRFVRPDLWATVPRIGDHYPITYEPLAYARVKGIFHNTREGYIVVELDTTTMAKNFLTKVLAPIQGWNFDSDNKKYVWPRITSFTRDKSPWIEDLTPL